LLLLLLLLNVITQRRKIDMLSFNDTACTADAATPDWTTVSKYSENLYSSNGKVQE